MFLKFAFYCFIFRNTLQCVEFWLVWVSYQENCSELSLSQLLYYLQVLQLHLFSEVLLFIPYVIVFLDDFFHLFAFLLGLLYRASQSSFDFILSGFGDFTVCGKFHFESILDFIIFGQHRLMAIQIRFSFIFWEFVLAFDNKKYIFLAFLIIRKSFIVFIHFFDTKRIDYFFQIFILELSEGFIWF